MPRWPAYLMGGVLAVCAYPALTSSPPTTGAGERYEARGNEPGWRLVIENGRADYIAGRKTISIDRAQPQATANGRRYNADRLTVDLAYSRCNDDLNGHGFEHRVTVTADGKTYRGCGGPRRTDWDV